MAFLNTGFIHPQPQGKIMAYRLFNPCHQVRCRFACFVLFLLTALIPLYPALASLPESPGELLQFNSDGHVLGFESDGIYVAGGNHVLKISFSGTPGVLPTAERATNNATRTQALRQVSYRNLWPGITLAYEVTAGGIFESIWQIAPGAAPDQISLHYNTPVEVETGGSLKIRYETGWMHESAPIAWQQINGLRIPIQVAFRKTKTESGEVVIGFDVGQYDSSHPLLIDPVLQWNTFMGSTSTNEGLAIAVDDAGNVYVTGKSSATWGTPVNAFSGLNNFFVAKLNSAGTLLWNTFLGGTTGYNFGYGITLDSFGNIYVTGKSYSTWGTPINAHTGSMDAFVAKLSSTGALQWNTFMGAPTYEDYGYGITLDSLNNIYVVGYSYSTWGTPINPNAGGGEAFVAKLNSGGARQWNTFMGSTAFDSGTAIAVDGAANIYVAGYSNATWGTTPITAFAGGVDAFVTKLNSSGARQWNTFIGSEGEDRGFGIALDSSNNVYVVGNSPTTWGTPITAFAGGVDVFVTKLNSNGAQQWNTFMGSTTNDSGSAIRVDGSANVYVTGHSYATWGTPQNAHSGNYDAFSVQLNSSGARQWNTFMGGTLADYGKAMALNDFGGAYMTGESYSTWGTPVNGYAGYSAAFIAKLVPDVCTAFPAGMVNWWNGDNNPNDNIGTENGTLVGDTTYGTGKVGQAFSFDGTGDQIDFPATTASFGSNSFTVDFWMNTSNNGNNTYIMGKSDPDSGLGWDIRLNNLQIQVAGINGWAINITTDQVLTLGTWHHVALTSNGITTEVYVDGLLRGSSGRQAISTTSNPFRIGLTTNFTGTAFTGLIDEVDILNRALAQAEVQAIYDAASNGKCGPGFMVSTSAPAGQGTFTPAAATVNDGDTTTFTVNTEPGYTIDSVTGCDGTWTGTNPYTTGSIAADCTVTAIFTLNSYTVSTSAPLGQGSFSPGSQTVDYGSTTSFDVTAEAGYSISTVSGCGGTWAGTNPYTTWTITDSCTVTATYTPHSYTVSTSAPADQGSITPGSRVISHGNTATFAVNAETGYFVSTVNGCGGTWTGSNPYTTAAITDNCTVTAEFRESSDFSWLLFNHILTIKHVK